MKYIAICLLVVFSLVLTNCDDQRNLPQNPPQINLQTASLSGGIGDTVTIRAHLMDDYVLKYAKLISPPLQIDTTIYISKKHPPASASEDVIKSEVDFSYQFTIPDIAVSGESYKILFRVKDVTGKISEENINLEVN